MKKNKKFHINTINRLFWPIVILVILIVAAIWTNSDIITSTNNQQINFNNDTNSISVQKQLIQDQKYTQDIQSPKTALMVQEGISHIVSKIKPSVVGIIKTNVTNSQQNKGISYIDSYPTNNGSIGSGFIIDQRGYILTSFQTIGKDLVVKIKIFSGTRKEYIADVVAVDSITDMALLKIRSNETFPFAILGNSDIVEVGDIILAIGSPFGFSRTVTMGIVSSNNRQITISGTKYPDLIQTDAAVNQGNDGGPLVNIKGEVIGINIAYFIPGNQFTGIGFAVPINDIINFVKDNI